MLKNQIPKTKKNLQKSRLANIGIDSCKFNRLPLGEVNL